MKIITVEAMRALERRAIGGNVSGYTLMLRAGEGAAAIIEEEMRTGNFKRAVILAGRGNNGGDALVVAAKLKHPVIVYAIGSLAELRGEAAEAARNLPRDIEVVERQSLHAAHFRPGDLIVDGLLGTGFSGRLHPEFEHYIRVANESLLPIIALDLPSGINGDTGLAESHLAIRAMLTITFGCPKNAHFMPDGAAHSGRLRLVDIGIGEPEEAFPESFFDRDAFRALPRPAFDDYKNKRGSLLVVAGSAEYGGAAVLVSTAALRIGAGLVTLATPALPHAALPAALIVRQGAFSRDSLQILMGRCDVVAAGSGWGEVPGEVLSALLESPGPLLLDADALNCAAREPERWVKREHLILTPHPGEAARLAEAFGVPVNRDRSAFACALARALNAIVVLKGPRTVTASPDGRFTCNSSGSPALATAGAGDVLAGLIAGLLAQNPADPFAMAALGVFLHGRAGEAEPLIADDLPERAAQIACKLRNGAN